tara:strand:+ start:2112 stop:2897 length:786 start_codon:yes stop_codon:yes gene_type:complete
LNNKIFNIWKKNNAVINGWLSIPNSFTAEAMAKLDWDSITLDMQHGQIDYSSAISMVQAVSNANITILTRVPWNEPGIIMKMLDLGVTGIISPMINTKEECEKFISYCYYPPSGQRSFGPMRSLLHYGPDYHSRANDNVLTFAMIETKQAIENLDSIMQVPNLSGVYIGPADMSSSYGLKPKFDVKEDPVYSNIKLIAEKAKKYNIIAGIHNGSVKYAKEMVDLGYKFITISSDYRAMTTYAESIVRQMKNLEEIKEEKTY